MSLTALVSVKLVSGTSTNNTLSGQLMVRVRNNDWRKICSGIGMNEASVACRELGFKNAVLLKETYLAYSFPYYVTCRGNESSLNNCSLGYRRCNYQARIMCYNGSADAGKHALAMTTLR